MKNKTLIILILAISVCFSILLVMNNRLLLHEYDQNYNRVVSNILANIKNEYPEVNEEKIMRILNSKKLQEDDFLKQYGIDISNESISVSNKEIIAKLILYDLILLIIYLSILAVVIFLFLKKQNSEIIKVTKYVEEINKRNYDLDLLSNDENNISILQNEIYKTMVMLREAADNSIKDKVKLKDSLSDISHQLKTPLTSINIMLDNIVDDEDMPKDIRDDFIHDIRREILNINFLVQNILKLSKFDANAINFSKEEIQVRELLSDVIKNVSAISDLKNVKIITNKVKDITINGDYRWEIEALTNILKNCIEHSDIDGNVEISTIDNKLYKTIIIKDYGVGIDSDDISHIFERFYKGKNSQKDSIGIGLALAKSILENDNATIAVSSTKAGTEFRIKYFN